VIADLESVRRVADEGWGISPDFGDARAEWRAARTACGVAETPNRVRLVARGDDRLSFLQGMLSNDVKGLAAGQGCHAAFLTDTAKVVTDMRVYVEAERVLLETLSWCREPLRLGLERYLVADDVELAPAGDDQPLLVLEGPGCGDVLSVVLPQLGAIAAEDYSHLRAADGIGVARASEVGGHGLVISGPAERRDALLAACLGAGATRLGARALTALRLEAGVPWARVDMDEDVLAMEMELVSAISFTKGCYLGQETVERVAARGRVNRRRTVFAVDGALRQALPCPVFAGDREVGRITSAGSSFLRDEVLGLGLLHVKAMDSEAPLRAGAGDSAVACTPLTLPLAAAGAAGG
jgi:folate-binding protein YgfZ